MFDSLCRKATGRSFTCFATQPGRVAKRKFVVLLTRQSLLLLLLLFSTPLAVRMKNLL